METVKTFSAPWGWALKVLSLLTIVVLVGVTTPLLLALPPKPIYLPFVLLIAPFTLIITALFTIRGYALTGHTLLIKGLLWYTKVDLSQLVTVEADPKAMNASIRLFGNGGAFAFSGRFANRKLGSYQAYATDPARSVVLKFAGRKTIVVTPEPPEAFIAAVKQRQNLR